MFLFVKYVNPSLYKRHFGDEEEDRQQEDTKAAEEDQMYSAQVESAQLLFNSAKKSSKSRTGFAGNVLKSLRQYLRYRFQSHQHSDESKQLVEVFDVLIRSKQRLQLFDLSTDQDLLLNPNKSNYIKAMQYRFEAAGRYQSEQAESDSVYILDAEPEADDEEERRLWDIRLNDGADFEQLHLIRFEIDRSNKAPSSQEGQKSSDKLLKITDVDLWMQGNRHCVVKSE